jgi:hypothetical protein
MRCPTPGEGTGEEAGPGPSGPISGRPASLGPVAPGFEAGWPTLHGFGRPAGSCCGPGPPVGGPAPPGGSTRRNRLLRSRRAKRAWSPSVNRRFSAIRRWLRESRRGADYTAGFTGSRGVAGRGFNRGAGDAALLLLQHKCAFILSACQRHGVPDQIGGEGLSCPTGVIPHDPVTGRRHHLDVQRMFQRPVSTCPAVIAERPCCDPGQKRAARPEFNGHSVQALDARILGDLARECRRARQHEVDPTVIVRTDELRAQQRGVRRNRRIRTQTQRIGVTQLTANPFS